MTFIQTAMGGNYDTIKKRRKAVGRGRIADAKRGPR